MSATILIQPKKEMITPLRHLVKDNFRNVSEDLNFIKELLDNGMQLTEGEEKGTFILTEHARLNMADWQELADMTENYDYVMPFEEIWMTELNGKQIAKGDYGAVNGEPVCKPS